MANCRIEGCADTYFSAEYCGKHYQRNRRHGDPNYIKQVHIKRLGAEYTSGWKSAEYDTYVSMLQRCNNPKNPAYKYYGGRGIKVCDRWNSENGFGYFISDVGPRPSKELSLDRIDNDGNYEPGNVRWTTRLVQGRNRRKPGRKFTEK